MNFFYCPKCGKESLEDRYVRSKNFVCRNMRGGRCTPPIIHYKCECGNYFRVHLDCKYAITSVPTVREQGKFQGNRENNI